jgi:hypothetical protein
VKIAWTAHPLSSRFRGSRARVAYGTRCIRGPNPVERLLVAASRAGARVAIPKPGERIVPATPPRVARWWPDVPWRTAEQAPVVSTGLRNDS